MGLFDIFKKKSTPKNTTTTFQLAIQNDILTDEQRENFYTSLETIAANLKKVSENGLQKNPVTD